MIDSIKIAHPLLKPLCSEELISRGWQPHFDEYTGKKMGWFYGEKDERKYPYLHTFTAQDKVSYLSAKVSLPAFIFGSNVQLPNQAEVNQALEDLSAYITEKSGIDFDARTAIVWEAHFTKDFSVGEYAMRRIITKLSEMNIPKFNKGKYSQTTLYFHSKGGGREKNKPRTICIYDKHSDCVNKSFSNEDIRKASGMLRLEFRYKTPSAIKRLVKRQNLPNREAQTILTEEISTFLLDPIEKQILLLLEDTDEQDRIFTLTKIYGKRRTAALIQYLTYLNCFGEEFYKLKSLNYSRSAYYECQKDCRAAGIFSLSDKAKTKPENSDVSY